VAEKEKPLWQRIYQEPVFTEVARLVGYSGTTYRELMEKVEPLKKRFGGQNVDSAIYHLATFEGDTTCNVKPLAHVSLRENARKCCFQLLGFPPEYKETPLAEILGLNRQDDPPKPEPAKPKRSRRKKAGTVPGGGSYTVKASEPDRPSPMMQQYREAKERHPDMMLLFRIGDFYELFDADAENAAKILGLTLTTRGTMPMAGFPHHQLEIYLQKLLKQGCRVAVCDRVDDAGGNDVERVVTPGSME
jgi:MutS domain I